MKSSHAMPSPRSPTFSPISCGVVSLRRHLAGEERPAIFVEAPRRDLAQARYLMPAPSRRISHRQNSMFGLVSCGVGAAQVHFEPRVHLPRAERSLRCLIVAEYPDVARDVPSPERR